MPHEEILGRIAVGQTVAVRSDRAFRGKRKVEEDHRNLDRSYEVLDELLRTLPDSTKLLEEHVDPAALLEESLRREARTRAHADARRASAELTKVRNLTP